MTTRFLKIPSNGKKICLKQLGPLGEARGQKTSQKGGWILRRRQLLHGLELAESTVTSVKRKKIKENIYDFI